jgi:hypothetical protein
MISTADGMQIDKSDEQLANAQSSIRQSPEPDSNITVDSFEHLLKQFEQRTWIDEGMEIVESNEHSQNPETPIRDTFEPPSNLTIESREQRLKQ